MPQEYPFGFEDLNKELEDELEPGEEFTQEDWDEIEIRGVPKRPSFPFLTFVFAVLLDVVNLFGLGFLGIITGIIAIVMVRMYLIGKYNFIKRWMWKKALLRLGIKSIPILGPFLLSWSFFILRAHSKNYERIDKILTAIEKLISES